VLRVGLIGCGNIGINGHLPAYVQMAEAELVAVCDVRPERAEQAAAACGATPYGDYRHLLDRADIDAVDLCVPTEEHAHLAIAALDAGKHVLCEKPIARTLAEADAMIAAAARAGRTLMIGHVRRFDHRYAEIKALLDAGQVGEPVFVRRAERQRLPFPAEAWYWQRERGGGVILDIGVHGTDLLRWYFGREAIEVYAVGRRVRETARQTGSFDHAFITCRFAGDGTGLVEASWAYPGDYGAALYGELDVVGRSGKVVYSDRDTNPLLIYTPDGGPELPRYFRFMSTTEYAFQAEVRHFVHCILDGRPPAISPQDARAALEMALAAQRSADIGQPVSLPLKESNEPGARHSQSDGHQREG